MTDCVFNLEIAREAARNRRLKQFVVELVLGWAGSKHKLQLDPKFKLPKIQYKGARVEAQRMRVDKKPVVLEVQARTQRAFQCATLGNAALFVTLYLRGAARSLLHQ